MTSNGAVDRVHASPGARRQLPLGGIVIVIITASCPAQKTQTRKLVVDVPVAQRRIPDGRSNTGRRRWPEFRRETACLHRSVLRPGYQTSKDECAASRTPAQGGLGDRVERSSPSDIVKVTMYLNF